MTPTLKELQQSRLVVSAKQVPLTKDVEKKLPPALVSLARSHARRINVYVFRYVSNNHRVAGFLIEPKTATKKPLPCIIYNRGGSEDFGLIKTGRFFLDVAEMALWGFVIIGSQYSGNAISEGHDEHGGLEVRDVLKLQEVLKQLRCADTGRIGMYGTSRGGMMTYLCLTRAKWIRAAVTIGGEANLIREAQLRPSMQNVFKKAFGGSVKEKRGRSAVFWPHKFPKRAPVLLMHGMADLRVSPLDSIELAAGLYKYKVPVRLIVFEGADHGLSEHADESIQSTRGWFDRFVKNKSELPDTKPHGE